MFIRAAWGRSYCTQQSFRTERVCKDDYALQNHPVNVRSHRERLVENEMTRILRHKGTPCMTSDGWVNTSALLEQLRCTRGEIETIATTSSKGGRPRFQCWWSYCTQRSHIVFIRAAWGRSYCTQRSHRERRLDAELERLSSIFTSAPSFSSPDDTDPPKCRMTPMPV